MSELGISDRAPTAPGSPDGLRLGLPSMPAPGPAAPLLEAVARMQVVRTRVPFRSLLVVAAIALVPSLASAISRGFRDDFPHLSPVAMTAVALLWAGGFALALTRALLPRPGSVLPDPSRAGRSALAVVLLAFAICLLFPFQAPGHGVTAAGLAAFVDVWWHCASWSLQVSAVLVAAGAVALRRSLWRGSIRIGAALGAAGGALAGLDLHLGCPYGSVLHVTAAHAGGVVIAAGLGALVTALTSAWTSRRS